MNNFQPNVLLRVVTPNFDSIESLVRLHYALKQHPVMAFNERKYYSGKYFADGMDLSLNYKLYILHILLYRRGMSGTILWQRKKGWIHFIDMIAEVIKYLYAFVTGNCYDTFKHQHLSSNNSCKTTPSRIYYLARILVIILCISRIQNLETVIGFWLR